MELTVKVFTKEIKKDKQTFSVVSVLTANNVWYRTAGLDSADFEDFDKEIVTMNVTRKYYKKVLNKNKEEIEIPTLVVQGLRTATKEEAERYTKIQDELNAETLKDVM